MHRIDAHNAIADWHSATRRPVRRSVLRLSRLESRVAPAHPVGPEFRVNTYTTTHQYNAAVAASAVGDFVVVWQSLAQDASDLGVYAQRYDAGGARQGDEFRVNSYVVGVQGGPAVAASPAGDFVVAWQSNNQDGSQAGVYAQRYDAAGAPQGGEFQVNEYTTNNQGGTSVAVAASGDFVIAWSSNTQDGDAWGVYARRYTAAGVPQGGEFQVNEYTTNSQSGVTVASDAVGNLVVTWHSEGQDGDSWGIYARRYDTAGTPLGSEFKVNTFASGSQERPRVAMSQGGEFVIAWESNGQDGDNWGIYARRYDGAGLPQGGEFRVNTATTGAQDTVRTAMDSDGDCVVVWQSSGQDGNDLGVYGQEYTANGAPRGGEFRANSFTSGPQGTPRVAMDANGNFVVVWQSGASTGSGQDGSGRGVYAQRFAVDAPRIANVSVNAGAAQRSCVAELAVSFDTTVTFAGPATDAFRLTRQGGGDVGEFTATAQTVGGHTVVTLSSFTGAETQAGSLADGRYTLTVFANQVIDSTGQALDGNGDGILGDDYVLAGTPANGLFRLFGDNDGDADVDAADFVAFRGAFGLTSNLAFDADGDGDVDAADFAAFRGRFGSAVP